MADLSGKGVAMRRYEDDVPSPEQLERWKREHPEEWQELRELLKKSKARTNPEAVDELTLELLERGEEKVREMDLAFLRSGRVSADDAGRRVAKAFSQGIGAFMDDYPAHRSLCPSSEKLAEESPEEGVRKHLHWCRLCDDERSFIRRGTTS